jgi:hypothetical protein
VVGIFNASCMQYVPRERSEHKEDARLRRWKWGGREEELAPGLIGCPSAAEATHRRCWNGLRRKRVTGGVGGGRGGSKSQDVLTGGDPPNPPYCRRGSTYARPHMCSAAHAPSPPLLPARSRTPPPPQA